MEDNSTSVLIDDILNVFVQVFINKEVDASSQQRYNPSNLVERENNNESN